MFDRPFGLTPTGLHAVLQAGGLAPSLHNSQPWAFGVTADSIEIYLDRSRMLDVADSTGAEARLACGAALFNIRLALERFGILARVQMRSTRDDGPLAVITFGGTCTMTPDTAELERAIASRRTNRRPFLEAEVPFELRAALTRAAEQERASLVLMTSPQETEPLRKLSLEAHRQQVVDPDWLAEWSHWTGRDQQSDGVPIRSAGPRPEEIDRWTLRDFGRSDMHPEQRKIRLAGKDFEPQPLIAVLCTWGDQAFTQLQAGQALQRVLLTATHLGLAASFLSQLIEVPQIRSDLRHLVGSGSFPQAVLRIGFGGPVSATPRRSVAENSAREPQRRGPGGLMFVRELMVSPALSLPADTPVPDAATFLVSHGFTGAPVTNDDGALIGIVTEADLIRGRITPDPRRQPNFPRLHGRRAHPTVAEVMTTPVESLTPGADAADAARMMVDQRIRMIPIVDGVTIVGILTRRDLLRGAVERSDQDLEADVLHTLRGSSDSERWRVTVQAGVAQIDDFLDRPVDRIEAERLAAAVPGIVRAKASYLTSDPS